jgi:HAD superfamily hydrolase (TIGR01509 family)
VVASEDTTRHKPEPDVFLEAARRLGVAPEKCIVYEDADLGIEAARRAGMRFIDVRLMP